MMRGFKFYNNLLGWIIGLVAFVVYELTLETSVSLWDCGEFIAASYKLMVVHPPGAPFFLMLGRLFSMLAPGTEQVAFMVNTMSALASAMAVMFTFWIITHYAGKLLRKETESLTSDQTILTFGAGIVGALSLTFMDSFWFSAVEAEVYALSSFFTMLTFWAALRWERSNSPYADRWLVLIALLIGISIGTHLLSLLVIPAVAFIYYFKKYEKPTLLGGFIAFLSGFVILTFVQNFLIPGVPKLMSVFDLFFVNTLSFGFGVGSMVAIILIIATVIAGIVYSKLKNKKNLNLAFVSLAYILLGYSSYAMVVIRSSANPPIDMNNPADPFNLLSYINREQYGDRPLLYGPYFNAGRPINAEEKGTIYTKGEDKYIAVGKKQDYVYDPTMQTFFPRMGDMQKDGSPSGYRYWSGMQEVQNRMEMLENQIRQAQQQGQDPTSLQQQYEALDKQKPTFAQNLQFAFSYQMGYMYWRYFMWNFAGRQNDIQGHSHNKEFEGNWISGIGFIDNIRLGPQNDLPDDYANNKARNKYYMLPLLLGVLGMVFQAKKRKNDFIVNLVFFLYTGLLIIVFLNQPPFEPRERDYAVVGSFQVFTIWIGLGVIFVADWLKKFTKPSLAAVSATAVSLLAVPVLMGSQGWDDHDRSGRRLGIDFAINYLESCAPNAILFTNGDNDTYPVWYAQNVEGIRTDVRVINMSLLPTDWYSSILLDKVYESEPLPLTLTKEDLRAGNNEVVYYNSTDLPQDVYLPYSFVQDYMLNPEKRVMDREGNMVNFMPARKFRITVDKNSVIKNNVVPMKDTSKIVNYFNIDYDRGYMHKGDLVFFNLLATNAERGWERPIYFTTTSGRSGFYGLEKYMQIEGLTYRLVPIETPTDGGVPTRIPEDILYDNLMNKFKWSNMAEKENFYLDDKAVLVPQNLQTVFVQFANELLNRNSKLQAELDQINSAREDMPNIPEGRKEYIESQIKLNKERSLALLDKIFKVVPETVQPMRNQPKYYAAITYHELGEKEKAAKHFLEMYQRNLKTAKYFAQFEGRKEMTNFALYNLREAINFMKLAKERTDEFGYKDLSAKINTELPKYLELGNRLGIM